MHHYHLSDIKTDREYSEVVCDEKFRDRYELTDGDIPTIETIKIASVSFADRIADLEDAVETIATKSKVSINLKAKAAEKEVAKK